MNSDKQDIDAVEFPVDRLKHIRFKNDDNQCIAILIDGEDYEILKGYGQSNLEALNDLHQTLF